MYSIVVNPDTTVNIPQVGTYVEKEGQTYQILKVTTFQEISPESPFKVNFTSNVELLHVSDEGENLGIPAKTVTWDESYIEL